MKLLRIFRIFKIESKKTKRNQFLINQYRQGKVLQVDKDVDNKKYIAEVKYGRV